MAAIDRSRVRAVAEELAKFTPDELQELRNLMLQSTPKLLERLRALMPRAAEPLHDIMELEGLGADLWRTIDVEEYIRRERDSWR